jgi:hypothetical protein
MTNSHQYQSEILRDRYGLKVAARLSVAAGELPHDVSERLRVARMQAVAKRKIGKAATAGDVVWSGGGAMLRFGEDGLDLWSRIASALPMIALAVGLIAVNALQNDLVADELAAVDSALLVDDLPPAAYADPGFAQFVKLSRNAAQ